MQQLQRTVVSLRDELQGLEAAWQARLEETLHQHRQELRQLQETVAALRTQLETLGVDA